MRFEHDLGDAKRRRSALDEYIEADLLRPDGAFICAQCASSCRPSAQESNRALVEGEMPHVGDYFSLIDPSGRPVRVVVMGQERGVGKSTATTGQAGRRGTPSVSIAQRSKVIQSNRQRGVRDLKSHINGTVCGLVALFAGGRPSHTETIDVAGSQVHVLDAFVLTNSTLCSAVVKSGPGEGKGKATTEMRTNCVRHAREMMRILAPTHLIVQGAAAISTVERALDLRLEVGRATDASYR